MGLSCRAAALDLSSQPTPATDGVLPRAAMVPPAITSKGQRENTDSDHLQPGGGPSISPGTEIVRKQQQRPRAPQEQPSRTGAASSASAGMPECASVIRQSEQSRLN